MLALVSHYSVVISGNFCVFCGLINLFILILSFIYGELILNADFFRE